jgi:hypothetical protein
MPDRRAYFRERREKIHAEGRCERCLDALTPPFNHRICGTCRDIMRQKWISRPIAQNRQNRGKSI